MRVGGNLRSSSKGSAGPGGSRALRRRLAVGVLLAGYRTREAFRTGLGVTSLFLVLEIETPDHAAPERTHRQAADDGRDVAPSMTYPL